VDKFHHSLDEKLLAVRLITSDYTTSIENVVDAALKLKKNKDNGNAGLNSNYFEVSECWVFC